MVSSKFTENVLRMYYLLFFVTWTGFSKSMCEKLLFNVKNAFVKYVHYERTVSDAHAKHIDIEYSVAFKYWVSPNFTGKFGT